MTLFIDLFLIAVGLSMDAFAASICKGLASKQVAWRQALITAFFFGAFQAIMPVIGWLLGSAFAEAIEPVDHWVAFVLLAAVGGKMIWDSFHEDDEEEDDYRKIDFAELLMLSVATSIDALVVGITFAMTDINIWLAITIIGITTFALSLLGFLIGSRFGARYKRAATIVGGVALILLGLKVLLEHCGFL